jgi:GNAT superfamily N-acetyltransferase
MTTTCFIRPYQPADRPAVRRICIATAWMGQPDDKHIPDDWLWAEYWTRYFTDREPQHTWVVQRCNDNEIVGYLTGTSDMRRFGRFVPFLLPGIILRVIRKRLMRYQPARKALMAFLRSFARGELELPPRVEKEYPATFHFNLLPDARRQGLGRRLFRTFRERMKSLSVPGIHAETLSPNRSVAAFLRNAGFRLLNVRPINTFAHAEPRPMDMLTWVLPLGRSRLGRSPTSPI